MRMEPYYFPLITDHGQDLQGHFDYRNGLGDYRTIGWVSLHSSVRLIGQADDE